MEHGKREKAERFVVFAKSKLQGAFKSEEIFIAEFETYPTDDELENLWNGFSENGFSENRVLYYLKVEKQVRFN